MMNGNLRLLIQEKIAIGNSEEALKEMEILCESPYFRRTYLVFRNRLAQLRKEAISNLIPPDEHERRQNKLNMDLLEFLDQLLSNEMPSQEPSNEDEISSNAQQNAKNIINIKNIEGDNTINL